MSKEYANYKEGMFESLNFNELRSLFRLYCSFRGTNTPMSGSYYYGIVNIGHDIDHFTQIVCASLDTDFLAIYARPYAGNIGFQAWRKIL